MSKQGNKTIEQQSGWSIEEVTQWPVMASYHNQGWCVSEDKSTFDTYIDAGDFYVIKRAGDRGTRPYCLIHIKDERFTAKGSGNCEINLGKLIDDAPVIIGGWLQDLVDARDDIKRRSPARSVAESMASLSEALREASRMASIGSLAFSSAIPRGRHLEEIDEPEWPARSLCDSYIASHLRDVQVYPARVSQILRDTANEDGMVSFTTNNHGAIEIKYNPPTRTQKAKAKYNAFIERLKV